MPEPINPAETTPPVRFVARRRVEFADTDAAGIVHFSRFFVFMEWAEHEFLRSLGLSVHHHDDEGVISWPRVSARCDYRRPARFEDVLEFSLLIRRLGDRSVTYSFEISLGGQSIAMGEVTAVCCRLKPGQAPFSIAIPAWIANKLRPFVSAPVMS